MKTSVNTGKRLDRSLKRRLICHLIFDTFHSEFGMNNAVLFVIHVLVLNLL